MAASVNKALIIGNVGRDPEIRKTNDGRKVATISVATSDSWKDKQSGERRENTFWHRVVVFDERLIEVVEQYVKKGAKLYVAGAMQTRKYTDKSGADRYVTEVVLNAFRGEIQLLDSVGSGAAPPPAVNPESYGSPKSNNDLDDEIPF